MLNFVVFLLIFYTSRLCIYMKGGVFLMKKILSVVLTFVMIFAFSTTAFATDVDHVITDPIEPEEYQGIMSLSNSISISGGIAKCHYDVNMQGGYKADVTTILQKSSGGDWSEVTSWSHSKVNYVGETKTRAVTRGYSYRLKTYVNTYDSNDNFVEGEMKISNTVHYYPASN